MLTYVLIAVGGALGSLLRAWLSVVMLELTGPLFPWGTILINILGSFVIGWFGTLTALDGRFAVSTDARMFVMVGFCGGFTTFSSFSLQTLDLFRDGRPGQAALNIALSVALCLLGVWLGVQAGSTLRESRFAEAAPIAGGALADRMLVALHTPEAASTLLAAAAAVMARAGDRTTVLAVDGPVLADLQLTEEILTAERSRELSARRDDWIARMRPVLDSWVAAEQEAGFRARWFPVQGDGVPALSEHAHGVHLLIMEYLPSDAGSRARLEVALNRAHRPVLLMPRDAALPDVSADAVAAVIRGGSAEAVPFPVRHVVLPLRLERELPLDGVPVMLLPKAA